MSDQLLNAIERYEQKFPEGFPSIPLVETRSDEEVIEIISECLDTGKDVYDLGYLELDDDIMY